MLCAAVWPCLCACNGFPLFEEHVLEIVCNDFQASGACPPCVSLNDYALAVIGQDVAVELDPLVNCVDCQMTAASFPWNESFSFGRAKSCSVLLHKLSVLPLNRVANRLSGAITQP